jgi:hypothetical protein
MAGYLMSLDTEASLQLYARFGVYATKLSSPKGRWKIHHEGTFADYVTMKPGDNIYFFIRRKIYGIGELKTVGFDCKFQNYPGAGEPKPPKYDEISEAVLWNKESFFIDQRWICTFRPAPRFFRCGLDMDDLLASNPRAFRMLRSFWKLSFIKFDDEENQAFRDAILRRNEDILESSNPTTFFDSDWESSHNALLKRLQPNSHKLTAAPIISSCAEGNSLGHEMAIEAGLLAQIAQRDKETVEVFGSWDYIHHQVPASPFKPIDYMDRMDGFGYSFIPRYKPTRDRYLVAEIKKDTAFIEDVEQLMKYVDWVKDEYAAGNYGMIRAFLVASDFDGDCVARAPELSKRRYIVGRRPPESREWAELRLVRYRFDGILQKLRFEAHHDVGYATAFHKTAAM